MSDLSGVLSNIKAGAKDLHRAGTFPADVLDSIYDHLQRRTISHSVETGAGASTLLFSHLSQHHTVFALDGGNGSIDHVRSNPLLKSETVTFVEGPTQKTIPGYHFEKPLQLALIDGPHGYPFPDLEYYFIYPHLEPGALLIVDDINVRSIYNLFKFLRTDKMFRLDQVARTTAFFTRTDAPIFDPYGDGWWTQGYNQIPPLRFIARPLIKRIVPDFVISSWRKIRR